MEGSSERMLLRSEHLFCKPEMLGTGILKPERLVSLFLYILISVVLLLPFHCHCRSGCTFCWYFVNITTFSLIILDAVEFTRSEAAFDLDRKWRPSAPWIMSLVMGR